MARTRREKHQADGTIVVTWRDDPDVETPEQTAARVAAEEVAEQAATQAAEADRRDLREASVELPADVDGPAIRAAVRRMREIQAIPRPSRTPSHRAELADHHNTVLLGLLPRILRRLS